jgi:hypothetical protein
MKHKYSIISGFVLLASVAGAKTTSINQPNIFPHFSTQIVAPSSGAGSSRIIAQTYLEYKNIAFQPIDSMTYSYSFGRGGELTRDEFEDNYVNFDESITYVYDEVSGTYQNSVRRFQVFDASNRPKLYTCQTWRANMATWRDSARFQYNYIGSASLLDNTVFEIWYGGMWAPHVVYDNVFDASNNVVAMNSTVYKMAFAYDQNNRLTQRTDKVWSQSTGWQDYQRFSFTYDASGNVLSYIIEDYLGGWQNAFEIEFTYAGADIASIAELKWDAGSWVNSGKSDYTYDAAHNKLSEIVQEWDLGTGAFVNLRRSQWTYNGYNQPLTYVTDTWNVPNGNWEFTPDDFRHHYYYQDYSITSVNPVPAPEARMNLYPIPAANELNIDVKLPKAQGYTIAIFDMQGKLIKSQTETSKGAYIRTSVDVSGIPAGNYLVKLIGTGWEQSEKFIVLH